MDDLLTTREVKELLKLDRTTIYRMVKEGRLAGVRVGQQWRFSRQAVEAALRGEIPAAPAEPEAPPAPAPSAEVLPLHCIQAIQDVFAELARVGSVTTRLDGTPLTGISNACRLCALIQSSAAGRAQCVASWRALAGRSERFPQVAACHAGLGYMHARIEVGEHPTALLVAGQFRLSDEPIDAAALARAYGLDAEEVAEAAREVPCFGQQERAQVAGCLQKVAKTFEDIGGERARMIARLRRIAALSALDDPAVEELSVNQV